MMRKLMLLVSGLALTTLSARADVVTGIQTGTTQGSYSVADNAAIAISYSVPGSSAANGQWAFKSLSFYLGTGSGTATLNSAVVSLFSANTSGGQVTTGTWLGNASGVNLSSTSITNSMNQYTLTWNEDNIFGNTTTKIGQSAGTYILGVTLGTSNDSNVFYGLTNGSGSSQTAGWALVNNGWGNSQSYNQWATGTTDFGTAGSASQDNYAMGVTGVAVPEPGTLLLGGIAAIGGAGGWWARRRKRAAPALETPEAVA